MQIPGGMQNMMKQLQQMQAKIKKVTGELEHKEVKASAGGDMVTVVVNGKNEVKEIVINKEVVNPDDIEMLQDLVVAAVNEGIRRSKEMAEEEIGKVTGVPGGLAGIPGLSDLM